MEGHTSVKVWAAQIGFEEWREERKTQKVGQMGERVNMVKTQIPEEVIRSLSFASNMILCCLPCKLVNSKKGPGVFS